MPEIAPAALLRGDESTYMPRRLALPSDYSHFTVTLFTFASRRAALRFRALRAAKETPALVQLSDIGGRDNVAEFPEPSSRAQICDK